VSRRLTLHLTAQLDAAIERIAARGNGDPCDNSDRRRAVERLVLDRARQLAGQGDGPAASEQGGDNALETFERLRNSRDRYRDLAVRAEAALLGVPVREDYGSIERRLERALGHHGLKMPPASGSGRPAERRRAGSRRRGDR